jgi:hypothetical protein
MSQLKPKPNLSGIRQGTSAKTWSDMQDADSHSPGSNDKGDVSSSGSFATAPSHPRRDNRTLILAGLPDSTTHKDITDVVRGGQILEMQLRHDHSATVTFVHGAVDFLAHAKRFGVYIHSRRIDVQWSDRKVNMPTHMATKLANGATRNIVVRGGARRMSEDRIRCEMEHIDRLVIVEVLSRGADVVVCTNSVYAASFMKTCMMSRRDYRGLRIDWAHDECADPLPLPAIQHGHAIPALRQPGRATSDNSTGKNVCNMFALLAEDPSESSDGGSVSDVRDVVPPVGLPINWASRMRISMR